MTEPTLPARLRRIQAEVERLAGAPIRWESSSDLAGVMNSDVVDGVPIIRCRQSSEAGVAEELLHLRLILSGVPCLSYPDNLHLVGQSATMLVNVLHHRIIYPTLEEWGYNPSVSECRAISAQLDKMGAVDLSRLRNEPALEALLAMVYARAKLDCKSKEVLDRVDHVFSADQLTTTRSVGEAVISTILSHSDSDPAVCRTTLATCLRVLGLSDHVTVS